jgi:hypothetical protein
LIVLEKPKTIATNFNVALERIVLSPTINGNNIPITKFQVPNKFQLSNNQTKFGRWNLDIGYYLVIGIWSLVI